MNPYLYVLSINGVLLLASLLFLFFPPKKINNFFGYRTKKSMLNEETWKFANTLFTSSLIRYASIGFVAAIIFVSITGVEVTWQPMVILVFTLVAAIMKTEQGINQHFDDEGKRIKK